MMRTASSGYSGPSNSGEVAALRKQVDLLSRRLDKQPRIPPPVITGGGGVPSGRRAVPTSTQKVQGTISAVGWSDVGPTFGSVDPPSLTLAADDGNVRVAVAGWYIIDLWFSLAFAAGSGQPAVSAQVAHQDQFFDRRLDSPVISRAIGDEVRGDLTTPPTYLDAGSWIFPSVILANGGIAPSSVSLTIEIVRIA